MRDNVNIHCLVIQSDSYNICVKKQKMAVSSLKRLSSFIFKGFIRSTSTSLGQMKQKYKVYS